MAWFIRPSRAHRARLNLESLEVRLNPSWTSAPTLVSIPSAPAALNLNNQQSATTAAAITGGEVDYYSFTPAWSSNYTLQASKNASQIDTILGLYNASGSRVAWNDDISNSNTNSLVTASLVAGQKYFLAITNYTGTANGNYTLGLKATLTDDAKENNDSLTTATNLGSLTAATTVSGLVMADTADYYKFTTSTAGGTVVIQFNNAQGDLDLDLLDTSGKVLASSAGTTDGEKVSMAGLAAGTYLLKVAGKSGAYNPAYSLVVSPAASNTPANPPPAKNDWTIAVYMTATDLASYGAADVNELEAAVAGLPGTVKISLLYDQWSSQKYATGGGTQAAWGDTGRAILTADTNMNSIKTSFERLGEKNTGDSATLTSFLAWTATAAPANHYGLVLWNHGSGLDGSNYDDESNDNLKTSEIVSAVKNSGVKLDMLCFDACLMGMTEVAYALKEITPVLVASQELEAGTGQDYTTTFAALKTNPALVTGLTLGKGMVDSWTRQYVGTGALEDTLSVIQTDRLPGLIAALNTFSSVITTADIAAFRSVANSVSNYGDGSFPAYRDLGQLMRGLANSSGVSANLRTVAASVVTALDATVFARSSDSRGSSGLSIYTPLSAAQTDSAFTDYAGYISVTNWTRVLGLLGV